MSFCARGRCPRNVTLGPALRVRTAVTEVTFTSMVSAVKFVADAPESEPGRFDYAVF
jgi:hypothetical protein